MIPLRKTSSICAAVVALLYLYGCDNGSQDKVPHSPEVHTDQQVDASADAEVSSDGGRESVAVWVNGEPLSESEIARHLDRIESIYAARQKPLDGSQRVSKRRLVTEKLIDQRLVEQWVASRDTPPVSAKVVEEALEKRVRESFGDRSILERHLERRGETLAEYRRGLRERIVLEHLLEHSPSMPNERPDAGSVEAKFEAVVARPPYAVRVRTASLFVPWPKDADRDAFRDQVVGAVTSASDFEQFANAATKLDSRWDARFEPDAGWTELGQAATDVERTLFATKPGHVTEAITTPLGVQLYFVRDREQTESPRLQKLRPVLEKRVREERFLEQRRALVDKLRKDAVIRWNEGAEER